MKFVLATDGSGYSRIAEEVLAKFDGSRDAEWDVVSVAVPLPLALPAMDGSIAFAGDAMSEAWKSIRTAHEETALKVADRLRAKGHKVRSVVLEGDAAQSTLDHCEKVQADVVAMGSRGLGSFMGFLLGSTARKLVSRAPCSVLIGHAPKDAEPDRVAQDLEAKSKLDVLVAADGTDGASQAIEMLMQLGSYGTGTAVCVEPLAAIPIGLNPADFGSLYRFDSERVKHVAESAAQRLANICDTAVHVTELGRPSSVIVDQAVKVDADLIVMGATQHGVVERFLLGSVSYEVATESPVSVLVVRTVEK